MAAIDAGSDLLVRPSRGPLALGLGLAVALHLGGVLLALDWAPETPQAEAGAGLRVTLGGAVAPLSGAPAVEMESQPLEQAEASPPEALPQEAPEALEPEPLPEVAQPIEPPPAPVAQPEIPELVEDIPLPAVIAEPEEVAREQPPEPAIQQPPKPRTKPLQEARKLEPLKRAEPQPQPQPQPAPQPSLAKLMPSPAPSPVPAPAPAASAATAAPVQQGAAGPEANTRESRGQQDGQVGLSGSGNPKVPPSYLMRLVAWLEKHKSYPRSARRAGMEGIVTLRFVLNRDGKVLSADAMKSSGHSQLDKAAEQLPWEAEPFPGFPDDMLRDELTVIVPLAYDLR